MFLKLPLFRFKIDFCFITAVERGIDLLLQELLGMDDPGDRLLEDFLGHPVFFDLVDELVEDGIVLVGAFADHQASEDGLMGLEVSDRVGIFFGVFHR